jgi:hypothetical protein
MSSFVIICQQSEDSAMFQNLPWNSMRFYDVPVNQSVLTEVNRSLTSYTRNAVKVKNKFLGTYFKECTDRAAAS